MTQRRAIWTTPYDVDTGDPDIRIEVDTAGTAPPMVVVAVGGADYYATERDMTPTEARAFADALTSAADQAENGPGPRRRTAGERAAYLAGTNDAIRSAGERGYLNVERSMLPIARLEAIDAERRAFPAVVIGGPLAERDLDRHDMPRILAVLSHQGLETASFDEQEVLSRAHDVEIALGAAPRIVEYAPVNVRRPA